MGTRGLMAFAVDGGVKGSYTQYDSYPDGLGTTMLEFVRSFADGRTGALDFSVETDETRTAQLVRDLKVIDEDSQPTAEDRVAYAHLWQNVSNGDDWYALLRGNQGNPVETLDTGVILDGLAFAGDSLFCEWAYVVDFDERVLEVYKGFQTAKHSDGRFSDFDHDGKYYPIRLIDTIPFDDLPDSLPDYYEDDND